MIYKTIYSVARLKKPSTLLPVYFLHAFKGNVCFLKYAPPPVRPKGMPRHSGRFQSDDLKTKLDKHTIVFHSILYTCYMSHDIVIYKYVTNTKEKKKKRKSI